MLEVAPFDNGATKSLTYIYKYSADACKHTPQMEDLHGWKMTKKHPKTSGGFQELCRPLYKEVKTNLSGAHKLRR